ncbi:MAG TPA: class I SAM-dependent rRNA methyltransferase [Opitutales bacterium]|jgi:23S rRNA (cytosine1962-C5)-methyltransferase|nr:class I SAM-dependent rRNA methyltransferase [Opitutales bacterium]
MLSLRLRPNAPARVLRGHPWVFAGELREVVPPELHGHAALLRDARGRVLGAGLCSGRSAIAWRKFSREPVDFDHKFITGALDAALARRTAAGVNGPVRRLVWSEADHIPGLVVDQYGKTLVVQSLTSGIENTLTEICAALQAHFSPEEIILRNDAPARRHEGLPLEAKTVSGTPYPARWLKIDDLEYFVDLLGAQKTGFYLDQRAQHVRVAEFAKGKRVLDGCCNQGAFALQCAKAGAKSVLGVDSSLTSVTQAAQNATKNNLGEIAKFETANLFDWFTARKDLRNQFDLIVLDPPSFAPKRGALEGALRGYKELNLRALRMLAPGGILATYCCSQNVGVGTFLDTVAEAAADAYRETRLLEVTSQPADHPILLSCPETHYLKGAIVEVE